jgi:hypothetical protein
MSSPAYGCPDKTGIRIAPIPTIRNSAGIREGNSTAPAPRGARTRNARAIASASILIATKINIRFCMRTRV